MTATPSVSITQGFLAQLLFDTEKDVRINAGYKDAGEVFNVATYLLAEAFRGLMHGLATPPICGVTDSLSPELLESLRKSRYQDASPENRAYMENLGRLLEELLKDGASRYLILGLLEGYANLKVLQNEAVSKNA